MKKNSAIKIDMGEFYDALLRILHLDLYDNYLINYLLDRKSTRLNSSHSGESRMPSSA